MLRTVDLFSGIGGFSLGLGMAGGFETIAFCEQDKFCQQVLTKHWPGVPIHDDIKTLPTDGFGRVDLVCGGFPCQPFSVAGQQKGAADDRDLWPEMASVIEKLRPRFVIGENVRGFINEPMGLQRSLSDLESLGYEAVAFVIPAVAVDAPHRRDRVWIVAHSNGNSSSFRGHDQTNASQGSERRNNPRRSRKDDWGQSGTEADGIIAHANRNSQPDGSLHAVTRQGELVAHARRNATRTGEALDRDATKRRERIFDAPNGVANVADSNSQRQQGCAQKSVSRIGNEFGEFMRGSAREPTMWTTEPDVGRVAHGIPRRVDRLKALGNAVVPQVVCEIGKAIQASYVPGVAS